MSRPEAPAGIRPKRHAGAGRNSGGRAGVLQRIPVLSERVMPTGNAALDCHARTSGHVFYKPLDSGFRRYDGSVRSLCLKSMIRATPRLLDLGRGLRVPRGNSDLIGVSLVFAIRSGHGRGDDSAISPGRRAPAPRSWRWRLPRRLVALSRSQARPCPGYGPLRPRHGRPRRL